MEAINVGGNFRKAAKLPVKLIIGAIVLVIFAILFFNSFYTVTDQEQAVVLTFGKVTSIESAGIHFKLPYPIQSVIKVPVQMTQKLELGYRDQGDGRYVTVDEESKNDYGRF